MPHKRNAWNGTMTCFIHVVFRPEPVVEPEQPAQVAPVSHAAPDVTEETARPVTSAEERLDIEQEGQSVC